MSVAPVVAKTTEAPTAGAPLGTLTPEKQQRLLSLDVFRGLVILAMLVVNNLGDSATSGYFWKHAGFVPATDGYSSVQFGSFANWWQQVRSADAPILVAFTQLPIWKHCTLADFVMPCFMLIIGLAMPFSVASALARGQGGLGSWLRVVKRAFVLVLLGWILCYFRDQFAPWWRSTDGQPFKISLGMDVLQLLGVGYLVSRVLYGLPAKPRAVVVIVLLLWHWALLRFWPQGDVPRGTFTTANNAVGHIYNHSGWWVWRAWEPAAWLSMNWKGLLSVPPAAGMMLLGTLMGDWLRREDVAHHRRASVLAIGGCAVALVGLVWAFDLPFNKDRWTPCYLLWCAGVGAVVISTIYVVCDIHRVRGWTYPLVVLGSNAIAAYFVTILAKVLLLNTPRVDVTRPLSNTLVTWGTLLFLLGIAIWATWLLTRATVRHIGPSGYGLWAVTGLLGVVLSYRLTTGGMPAPTTMPATQPVLINLTDAVTLTLKRSLGPWEGGWVFTWAFVLFWWLVLDLAYRRRIFWKI